VAVDERARSARSVSRSAERGRIRFCCSNRSSFDLHRRRHLADLVEEQRAAVGELEAALAARCAAGERALLVAEQLALEQLAPGIAAQLTASRMGPLRAVG
jgi:hypothetical protein